jgi:hypothetical protein
VNLAPGAVFTTLFFFVTYEWTQKAKVLLNRDLERVASDKQLSLLGTAVSYKENEVL